MTVAPIIPSPSSEKNLLLAYREGDGKSPGGGFDITR
jgi:hypothetical protein